MNINSHGFAHIFLLVIIVLIGFAGIGYFAFKNRIVEIPHTNNLLNFPTSNKINVNISSWDTYSNYLLGYSIKHPPQLEIHSTFYKDTDEETGEKIDLNRTPYIKIIDKNYEYLFNINEETYMYKDRSFEDNAYEWYRYYYSSTAEMGNADVINSKKVTIKIDGIDAIKYIFQYNIGYSDDTHTAVWVYIPLKGTHLLSVKYNSIGSVEGELELYNQILSTFRFIDNKNPWD